MSNHVGQLHQPDWAAPLTEASAPSTSLSSEYYCSVQQRPWYKWKYNQTELAGTQWLTGFQETMWELLLLLLFFCGAGLQLTPIRSGNTQSEYFFVGKWFLLRLDWYHYYSTGWYTVPSLVLLQLGLRALSMSMNEVSGLSVIWYYFIVFFIFLYQRLEWQDMDHRGHGPWRTLSIVLIVLGTVMRTGVPVVGNSVLVPPLT